MAQIAYRANLSSAVFPMTLADAGRTVINPQADQNFDRRVDPAGEQKDAGIPQAIYVENVIPTVNGYQSVGYRAANTITLAGRTISCQLTVVIFDSVNTLEPSKTFELIFYTNNTVDCNFSSCTSSAGWVPAVLPVGFDSPLGSTRVSYALVRGVTYLHIYNGINSALYTLANTNAGSAEVTFTDITGTLTGVTAADFYYITGSYNYLIGIGADSTIYWSSTTTATDFVPSLVTGAGSETPGNTRTEVRYLLPHPDGFYIYTYDGVVFAAYTGNSRYPWKFREIPNSPGIPSPDQLTASANLNYQICVDRSGKIFTVAPDSATGVAPEVSEFLEKQLLRDIFTYATNTFSVVQVEALDPSFPTPRIGIAYLLNRYIIVSYSTTALWGSSSKFDYALIYDMQLQRIGKFRVPHHRVIAGTSYLIFVDHLTGLCKRLVYDIYDTSATFEGVLFLGKFQFIRERNIQLNDIEIECGRRSSLATQNFSLLLFPSLDGKNFSTPITLTPAYTNELIVANTRNTAVNHSIMLKGAFDVNTLQLRFRVAGDR